MNRTGACVVGVICCVLASGTASAQGGVYRGHVTGHLGATFSQDLPDPELTAGASMSVQEDSGWGAELDFGYANDSHAGTLGADLTTFMVNVNWVKPTGPLHPYALVGAGTIGAQGCLLPCPAVSTTWDFGLSMGAGARYDLTDSFSLGADARYFFSPGRHEGTSRPENFGFWRVAFGATYSWAIVQ